MNISRADPFSGKGRDMHELSIAQSLIDEACQAAAREGCGAVSRINIRVGSFCGVNVDALRFAFEVASESTACEGAVLSVEEIALTVECHRCKELKALHDSFLFICPTCGSPTPKIVTGQELELVSIEVTCQEFSHDSTCA
jgi:hydrogenase nickel incorporation protein HypA/HybF